MEANEFYTIKEVAKILKVCANTIRNLLHRKELGASKVGKQWRISDVDVQDYLDKKKLVANSYPGSHPVRKVLPFAGPKHTDADIFGDDSESDDLFA